MEENIINRRNFLQATLGGAAFVASSFVLPGVSHRRLMASVAPAIVVANGEPKAATRAAVTTLGGMKRFVSSGSKVVIKPNMSFPNPPEVGSTTHPDVIRELVTMCLEAGASSVLVLDNPLRKAELCLEKSGIKDVCDAIPQSQAEGVTSKQFYGRVDVPKGIDLKSTMIMKQVIEADVLIAAPVAKSHSSTGVSLAMKGMMGLIYDRREFHLDLDLNTAIVDLCTVLYPKLTVVDATRVLSDGGPGGPGKVISLKKVIASTDMVAADAMAVELGTWYDRKFKASQVKHILMAHQRQLGNMDISSQTVQEVSA